MVGLLNNLKDILIRARQGKPLTAQEASFVHALYGLIIGIAVTLGPQFPAILAGKAPLSIWQDIGGVAICIICLAVSKLWVASNPQQMANAQILIHYADEAEQIVAGAIAVQQLPKLSDVMNFQQVKPVVAQQWNMPTSRVVPISPPPQSALPQPQTGSAYYTQQTPQGQRFMPMPGMPQSGMQSSSAGNPFL